jgi:hypothetical protein
MKTKIVISVLFFFLAGITNGFSQTYTQPNVALKSHETLEILKVEMTPEKTIIFLTIENRIDGGNFCADKNIYITVADGEKFKLRKSAGIPSCPETYKFKSIGEKLEFKLEFPPLRSGIKWIDIVEDCSENCFSFYGVTLNAELNANISKALEMAEKGETTGAIGMYRQILENLGEADKGVKAALYTDIITLYLEKGDKAGAEEWYNKMVDSKAPQLELYIKNLNSRGIKY